MYTFIKHHISETLLIGNTYTLYNNAAVNAVDNGLMTYTWFESLFLFQLFGSGVDGEARESWRTKGVRQDYVKG